MKIIDIVKMDDAGRITLDNVGLENMEGVRFSIDLGKEMIEIVDSKKSNFGKVIIPDQRTRITIPKQFRDELESKDILVLIDEENDNKLYLSAKTGKVL